MNTDLNAVIDADEATVDKMATDGNDLADAIGTVNSNQLRDFLQKLVDASPEVAQQFQQFISSPAQNQEQEASNLQYQELEAPIEDADDVLVKDTLLKAAQHCPLRLTYDERKLLRLLESALHVSEYTDRIDVASYASNKTRRMAQQIKQMCAILSGLVVAHNYDLGKRLINERDFENNAEFFQMVFEIGRRYKILNPERMRDSYGKLMYLLMDSVKDDVGGLLNFSLDSPIRTVYSVLKEKNGLDLLRDPLLEVATSEIFAEDRPRHLVQRDIQRKNDAVKKLAKKHATVHRQSNTGLGFFRGVGYSFALLKNQHDSSDDEMTTGGLTEDDIEQCIYSLSDHATFLRFNRDPVTKTLMFLRKFFSPDTIEPNTTYNLSLAIRSGENGARLSHPHQRQYNFVMQTLILWKNVLGNMFELWQMADWDLLDEQNGYRLRETGQGLQRVQAAPRVYNRINQILGQSQREAGGWLGSSMVHLGDHNVPNALMFIDKYTQVPRILGPLVTCIEKIESVAAWSAGSRDYINTFGGVEMVQKLILADFFRHGFDGSGADNFYDAGSCVDGRLTSAWNWCSKIEKKPYFPVMLLTGFTGFDGKDGW